MRREGKECRQIKRAAFATSFILHEFHNWYVIINNSWKRYRYITKTNFILTGVVYMIAISLGRDISGFIIWILQEHTARTIELGCSERCVQNKSTTRTADLIKVIGEILLRDWWEERSIRRRRRLIVHMYGLLWIRW